MREPIIGWARELLGRVNQPTLRLGLSIMNKVSSFRFPSFAIVFTLAAGWSLAACGDTREDPPKDPVDEDEGSGGTGAMGACDELGRAVNWVQGEPVESTAVSTPERIRAVGDETWNLALRMLSVVPGSVANSPASMYAALGMTYERHRANECSDRIAEVLSFPEEGDAMHNTLGSMIRELESRAQPETEFSPGTELTLRQSIWTLDTDTVAEPSEIDRVYGATQHAISGSVEEERALMNCVIEEQSHGLLVDFMPPGQPNGDTEAYDMNVSFLAAPWAVALNPTSVDFTSDEGVTQTVDGMSGTIDASTTVGDEFLTVDVPFLSPGLSVLFAVPHESFTGTSVDLGELLTKEALDAARADAARQRVIFRMPRVTIDSTTEDFNRDGLIPFDCPVFTMGALLHGAAVEFDEKGVKAAAATVVEDYGDSAPEPPSETISLDRPFYFFIYDADTNTVLFSGRYLGG